jgi:Xaa-Pro aminopeptidase
LKHRDISAHREVQSIAKAVLKELGHSIGATDTERTIAIRAASLLAEKGLTDTWYYSCPAFVLLGSRSCASVSGSNYVPSDEPVGEFNLVTIDLSPCRGDIWGDCARSFCIEQSHCVESPEDPEFYEGLIVEAGLHAFLHSYAQPDLTFDHLFRVLNARIDSAGYENLDFQKNLGHSIEQRLSDRVYIERGNFRKLKEVSLFTFEPHIRRRGGQWRFKYENIYFVAKDGSIQEL